MLASLMIRDLCNAAVFLFASQSLCGMHAGSFVSGIFIAGAFLLTTILFKTIGKVSFWSTATRTNGWP